MIWQEDDNARWLVDVKPKCYLCGKKADKVLQMKAPDQNDDEAVQACFVFGRNCWERIFYSLLGEYADSDDEDFVYARLIEYKPLQNKKQSKAVGLSKRYNILKRDNFSCVLCGATGKESKLEVDHIIPRSSGGGDGEENLQTLCFACNRGKRDKAD